MESTTPQRRRSSAVLDSPWSASTCSDSSPDTPFERSPITPATGSGAGEDFASYFVVSPLRKVQARHMAALSKPSQGPELGPFSSLTSQRRGSEGLPVRSAHFASPPRRAPRPPSCDPTILPRRPSSDRDAPIPMRTTSRTMLTDFPRPPPRRPAAAAGAGLRRPSLPVDQSQSQSQSKSASASAYSSRRQAHEVALRHMKLARAAAAPAEVVVGCAM